ncbi:organelle RRM domain-containing protein 1, chloroplastic [Ziziphus jujuba]|uniref:Organelle RRM domain-containing protein 1, chloroplastic n=1 Tax=Ziziphus jujuba TaxID=326968 RepID=A0A6P3YSN2_ZIZJJ|nr:organelle RRM domain-containing protein 1, chloroplastic [Ziziphus jujuba]
MEVLSNSAGVIISKPLSFKPQKTHKQQTLSANFKKFPNSPNKNYPFDLSSSSSSLNSCITRVSTRTSATSTPTTATASTAGVSLSSSHTDNRHWMVLMKAPPQGVDSKPEVIDYYVETLERVLGSEMDAQMCIYDASWDTHFGFCCDIDAETSLKLASLPGVLSVRPDPDINSLKKDYNSSNVQLGHLYNPHIGNTLLFPLGNTKHWLVRMEKPGVGVVTKAQMADYYAQILAKVLGNEKDAQMCIYHISWQSNFGFCCELDEECARELAGVPGVLSVQPDKYFESENKDYGGSSIQTPTDVSYSAEASQISPVETKKLFVTGLSFYTSEKSLRAAFESFGELVEVKIIMDKISKRSKGYAFIEYTTKEAAGAALKEMNGKIINGWMIVVDVAKSSPPRYSRGRRRDEGSPTRDMERGR